MTISTTQSQVTVLGNGVTTTFSFPFVYDSSSAITVIYTDTTGIGTVLATSQYTLFLNPPAGNSIWGVGGTVTYAPGGSAIGNGTSLTILRTLPLTQTTSVSNQGPFAPTVIEAALDTNCMQSQQVAARTGQIRGIWNTPISYSYGDVVQDGAFGLNTQNYYMCAIANTSGTWATDLSAGDWVLAINVQQISGYSTSAAASATAAAASAVTASGAASTATAASTTATTQAGIATTQATAAAASAVTAATQATSASTSATSASTSATTATTQAGIATTQATAAATSATTATTQAGIATTQATAAASSAVIAASTLTATSTTSNAIGMGSKSYTIQTNKQFQAGQFIVASNGANYNAGSVTSYDPSTGALVISSTSTNGSGTFTSWNISISGQPGQNGIGTGTVTSVAVTTQNGVSASVTNPTSTPTLAFTLGAITPSTVNGVTLSGSSTPTLAVTGTTTVSGAASGTNTGDQTITLTGDVTGTGTGSFAATIGAKKVTAAKVSSGAATSGQVLAADGAGGAAFSNAAVISVAGKTGAVTLANTDISGLGTASTLNAGTSANNVMQLDGSGNAPAVNGSALTSLNASNLSSGTVGTARLASGSASSSTFLRGDQTWAATSPPSTAGGVGTYVMANAGGVSISLGGTLAGSFLRPCSADGTVTGAALTGTWQAMGALSGAGSGAQSVTLFLRIS